MIPKFPEPLSNKDNILIDKIYKTLDSKQFPLIVSDIYSRLHQPFDYLGNTEDMLKIELVLSLIDFSKYANNEDYIFYAINLLTKYYNETNYIEELHYHYSLGNAYEGLFVIHNPNQHLGIPNRIEYLMNAKYNFFKAYKTCIDKNIPISIELLNNLGNVLQSCYRFSEVFDVYDVTLSKNPKFSHGNLNRARCLVLLPMLTYSFTPKLISHALIGFVNALEDSELPSEWRDYSLKEMLRLKKMLEDFNVEINNDFFDDSNICQDFNNLTKYIQFCINNKLILNSHALYCKCEDSSIDDLSIDIADLQEPFNHGLHFVLNHIKSEFIYARWLYYHSLYNEEKNYIEDNRAVYDIHELKNCTGENIERLKSSFKICFSILDRIAAAICKYFNIYDVIKKGKKIYFDSFWKCDIDNKGNSKVWSYICEIKNPFILSLYSLAFDLDNNGIFREYKQWRNYIEHNFLVLLLEKDISCEQDNNICKYVSLEKFSLTLEHLLKLTSSAIFSFVYCIRWSEVNK